MNIDYRPMLIAQLEEACEQHDLTFGQILYSILRKKNLKTRSFTGSEHTKFLLEIEDKDLLTALENFLKSEK